MDFFNITYEEFLKIRVDEAREDGIEEGLEKRFDLSKEQTRAYYEQ